MLIVNKLVRTLFIIPIKIYQIFLSPLLGQNKCRFYPTCSSYAISAIKNKGVFKGIWLAFLRILRCNPWGKGGYDPVDCNKKH
jgi:putative membrane protein insertion efficiency factor